MKSLTISLGTVRIFKILHLFFNDLLTDKFKCLSRIWFVLLLLLSSSISYSQIPDFYWAKGLEGSSAFGSSVAVDPTGNVYTAGHFKSNIDLDPGSGTFMLNSLGNDDGYISKLDVHGDFVWGKQIGGADWDQAIALTLDSQNNIYVVGYFQGTVNFGSVTLTATGLRDIFVCKLDDLGNFIWAKAMHGDERNDKPQAIATDGQDNVIITGGFKGTVDFNPGAGTSNLSSYGLFDIFVTKLDPAGNFMWAKQMGGVGNEWGGGITVDGSDNILVTGNFRETSDFAGVTLTTDDSQDVFVCKLANDGTQLWVKQFEGVVIGTTMGGSPANPVIVNVGSSALGKGIATDNAGNVYTTGSYKGNVDFDPSNTGTFYIPSVDSLHNNIFVSKLSSLGDFEWAKMIGNNQTGESYAIDVNTLGNVYISGRFYGTLDFNPSSSGTYDLTSGGFGVGGSDAFIGVLDDDGDFVWAGQFEGSDSHVTIAWDIKVDDLGRIYTTGYFGYDVDFDPGSGVFPLSTPAPNTSTTYAFVHKIADSLNASFTASSNTICEGESITFTDASSGMGIQSWSWTFDGGLPATASTQGPHDVEFNSPGTYNITLEIEDDLTDTDDTTIVITVNAIPLATAGATNITLCEGEDIELTAGNVTGATYAWVGPDGYTSTTQNPILSNVTSDATGTYSLTVTNNGCSAEDDIDITVHPTPSFTLGFTDPTTCGGTEGTISISGLDAGSAYEVSYDDDGVPVGPLSKVADGGGEIVITGLNAGEYTNFFVDIGGCSETESTVITLSELSGPSVDAGTDQVVCEGTMVTLMANNPDGAMITWNHSVTDGVPFSVSTTLTYTVSAELNGCTSTDEVLVTVHPTPSFTVGFFDPNCGNSDGKIIITPATGVNVTEYSIDNGVTTQTDGIFSNLNAGNYIVYVKSSDGCEATQPLSLSNSGAPTIDTIDVTSTSCIADDGTITITASGGTGTIQYSIDNGITFQNNPLFTGLGNGNYDIVVKDFNDCEANKTATINQMNGPSLTLVNSNDVSCFGADDGSAEVNATGGSGNYTYDWSPIGGNAESASDLPPDNYTVTVEDDDGCKDQLQVPISEPNEIVIVESITDTDCGLDNGEIELNVTGGTGSYTFDWSPNVSVSNEAIDLTNGIYEIKVTDGLGCSKIVSYEVHTGNSFYIEATPDSATILRGESTGIHLFIDPNIVVDDITWTPSEGLSCSDCNDPIAKPENSITYIVTVTDDMGCTSQDTVKINVILPCPDVFVPNTFSPNTDGLNDFQCVLGGCIASMEFTIYDRWGEPIFYSEDQSECWDGTYKGELVQSGVYVYRLKVTLDDGGEHDESGNITVLR